jgi:3-oxoadipate CoA-transferase alpha subunit
VIDKTVATCDEAVADIFDGAALMLGGFGSAGVPGQLIEALRRQGATRLAIIQNGSGSASGDHGVGGLFVDGRIRKLTASFINRSKAGIFRDRYVKGEVELELLPQGTLAERIRAAGAGIGGFYTPTAAGTELAKNKEHRMIDGRAHVFESPLRADFAFVKAHLADRLGNLCYRYAMRNFNPLMAMAARVVIVEADRIVPVGELDPDHVHTPGIFVDRVVQVERDSRYFTTTKAGAK